MTHKASISLLIGLCFMMSLFSGCKQAEDDTPVPYPVSAKTRKLCAKKWKVASGEWLSPLTGPHEDLNNWHFTEFDNTYSFTTNGKAVLDEEILKFYPSSPQTFAGSWRFKKNETELVIDIPDEIRLCKHGLPYTIVQLSSDTLMIRCKVENRGLGVLETLTYTLVPN